MSLKSEGFTASPSFAWAARGHALPTPAQLPAPTASHRADTLARVAKQESPLVQLISSSTSITTIAEVTFYGRDQVGNDISVTGSIQVDFGNFGDF